MKDKRMAAALCALLAAVFYALNMPCSKLLLSRVDPAMLAALLYLGAGAGVGAVRLLAGGKARGGRLTRRELPATLGMIALDVAAPLLLMAGLATASAASAALLNNFEIVATSLFALLLFRERITPRLWGGVALITLASVLLTAEGTEGLAFSRGSLLVLAAACCWGLENNCTRALSDKSTYEIVILKGICSGSGALLIALGAGERLPSPRDALLSLLLGFLAYGLSIFFYIRAQSGLGAAKTSAYYALAPFIGTLLSHLLLNEKLSPRYLPALLVMLAGSGLVAADTLLVSHNHAHTHTVTHTHGGTTHTHVITHAHGHEHFMASGAHEHRHTDAEVHRCAAQGMGQL